MVTTFEEDIVKCKILSMELLWSELPIHHITSVKTIWCDCDFLYMHVQNADVVWCLSVVSCIPCWFVTSKVILLLFF